jgi:hypothetical protein
MKEAIEEVLLPQQVERLEEIGLQIQGTAALLTEPVQKALKITAEQKTKFEGVHKETQEKGQELFSGIRELFQGGDREKAQAAMQEIREKMKGKPVEISPEELRPSRGGQGGQRPGGQRPEGGQRPAPATRPAT